ncbi:MAG: chemotaxis protein CheB, partial [Xanthomonadaceae bacterium]|nr:chemotaxis protein CheB [Xanthomonadaceae bacterium]
MVETQPSVALLFDDAELGAHLRQVLQECGARIVHEGAVAGFDAATLHQHDPDVLVVNLDDDDDDAFDRLFGMVDGDRPRLVLNDARASRALSGWDRARWARHFAVKVLAGGDVDPPRPAGAQAVAPAPAVAGPLEPPAQETESVFAQAAAEPDTAGVEPEASEARTSDDLEAELAALLAEPSTSVPAAPDELQRSVAATPAVPLREGGERGQDLAESDDLEAELAALLAGDALLPAEDVTASTAPRQELPLHDGNFSLAPHGDERANTAPAPEPVAKAPSVPHGWALVDHDEAAVVPAKAADFGIEKLSAADFLAPDVEPAADDFVPTLSLELVSM